ATVIAERIDPASADDFSLCGLLLEVGRLALLATFENEYRPVLDAMHEGQLLLPQIEQEWLGIQHAEVGAQLMEQWKMPPAVIAAIRWHHAPLERLEELRQNEDFPILAAMAVASCA